jgi:hypothetical protein
MENRAKRTRPLAFAVTFAAALFVISIGAMQNSPQNGVTQNVPTPMGGQTGFRPMLTVNSLGPITTLDQARNSIGVSFSLPATLPSGATLVNVRARTGLAAVVYYEKSLPQIPFYDNATVLVLILRDNSSFSRVPTSANQPNVYVSQGNTNNSRNVPTHSEGPILKAVTISGHQGWGSNPSDLKAFHDSGRLDWWANNVHYVILADLPLDTLVAIAQSMKT